MDVDDDTGSECPPSIPDCQETDDSDPVRKGDQIVSKIWHDGKFLTIALHGNY